MDNQKKNQAWRPEVRINPPVFLSSAIITLVFVILAVLLPKRTEAVFTAVQAWITETVGWFYVLSVAIFVIFVVYLAVSRNGQIKLGPDHSEPEYNNLSWFAMLFSAGMGIGLLFFGVAEPVMHYMTPPAMEGGTIEAARAAMNITFFHWGIHAWAIYAVVALSLAYFSYRHNLPLAIRSSLYPLIGDRIYGPIGHTVDTFAVLGTLFGVATSLGLGVLQINAGLQYVFGVPNTINVQIIIIIIVSLIAMVSVVSGLNGGIKRISEFNMGVAGFLVLFVLITGPTIYLLQTLVQNTGAYLSTIVGQTFNLYAYEPTGWIGGWTLFYWGWWIAWSPFVGMFIARVSRGRTIREFIVGVLMVPVGFTFMWMTFFGNTAIHMIMQQGITDLALAVDADTTTALFQFFEYLPFSTLIATIATILVVTFFVTSSDSGSLVIDMLTNGGEKEGPVWQRIFWASTEGLVAIALLLSGGLLALQTAAIASALPFTVVMLLMCWGLFQSLRVELVKQVSLSEAILMPKTHKSPVAWQDRLKSMIHHPKKESVLQFMQSTVHPAFDEVAEVFKKNGMKAIVKAESGDRIWIEVLHGEEIDFFYSVRLKGHAMPSFTMAEANKDLDETKKYYRAEIYLKEGGQDYDIMGWTKEQVINNVLDQYEKHIHFLHVIR
ncbi:BCCT family transporter [Desulfuribacillus alkaliarsenatis]|uniref:Choline transporter n=1 Tax=Desulfuribacillus alkaliarsenatis TaxID=766136 RepID=A0A1E5G0U9_9FIRM|nr:choline BCCT transporter BetT [Desulfuribacillus alkaliarsenatis]OEF96542.1 choline transporter [Desulfuribacillus alkaliarsenatis]